MPAWVHQGQIVLDKPDCLPGQSNLLGWWGKAVDVVCLCFSKAFSTVSHSFLVTLCNKCAGQLPVQLLCNSLDQLPVQWVGNWPTGSTQSGGKWLLFYWELAQVGSPRDWCWAQCCFVSSYVVIQSTWITQGSSEYFERESHAAGKPGRFRLESGQRRTFWSSARTGERSSTWEKKSRRAAQAGSTKLRSNSVGRDQGVPVSKKLNKSEELLLKQRSPVRSWAASTGASSRDYPILVSVCQATPGILLSVLVSPVQKRYGRLGRVEWRAIEMIRGLRSLTHLERLRELGLFNIEKWWFRGNLSPCYSIWRVVTKKI